MNTTEKLQQKISYFDNSNKTKERIIQSESQRLRLELELNKLINSDETIQKQKAIKLKAYYQKVCDDEAKSLKRNQGYLNNLQRIDSQFGQLEAKLERLTNLKKECEIYLRTTYPKFMHDNRLGMNQENVENIMNDRDFPPNQGGSLIAFNLIKINTLNENKLGNDFLDRGPSLLRDGLSSFNNVPQSSDINRISSYNVDPINKEFDLTRISQITSPKSKTFNDSVLSNLISQNNSPTKISSMRPNEESAINNLIPKSVHYEGDLNNSFKRDQENLDQNQEEDELKNEFIKKLISSTMAEYEKKPENQNNLQATNNMQGNFGGLNTTGNILLKEYEQEVDRQDHMNETMGTMGVTALVASTLKNTQPQRLTPQGSIKSRTNINSPISEESEMTRSNKNDVRIIDDDSSIASQRSLRQELNIKSMYRLLDYIELEMQHTIHPEKYYRQVEPHYKNKLDIIKCANEGSGALNAMDSASITMVIQDQLPSVIRKYTTNSCLLSKDLLGYSVSDINEIIVRNSYSSSQDRDFWDHLFKHFLSLKRMASLDSGSIAKIFAPALVGDNVYGVEKAEKFVEKLINLEATKYSDILAESQSFTETSMNKSLQLASSSKLKETSAYQQFIMGSTNNSNKSTMKKHEYSDEDDENDEIDALVAPKSTMSYAPSVKSTLLKSPRKGYTDFDFSQVSSVSEVMMKKSGKVEKPKSARSNKDSKKLPIHLRDFDDSEDSEADTDDVTEIKTHKSVKSENSYDFYN